MIRTFRTWQWAVLVLAGWIYMIGPGRIDGHFQPAAERATITRVEIVGAPEDPAIYIYGTSARLRPECSWRAIEWFIGRRGGQNVETTISFPRARLRKNGPFEFGPWRVGLESETQLRANSYGDVLHQCYLFPTFDDEGAMISGLRLPWLTRTRLFN